MCTINVKLLLPYDGLGIPHLLDFLEDGVDVNPVAEFDPCGAMPALDQVDEVEHRHKSHGDVDVALVTRRHLPATLDRIERKVYHHLPSKSVLMTLNQKSFREVMFSNRSYFFHESQKRTFSQLFSNKNLLEMKVAVNLIRLKNYFVNGLITNPSNNRF